MFSIGRGETLIQDYKVNLSLQSRRILTIDRDYEDTNTYGISRRSTDKINLRLVRQILS